MKAIKSAVNGSVMLTPTQGRCVLCNCETPVNEASIKEKHSFSLFGIRQCEASNYGIKSNISALERRSLPFTIKSNCALLYA
jgi:hypothetical protein